MSAPGDGLNAVWIANVEFQGINAIGSTRKTNVMQTVSAIRMRAAAMRRRQYISQNPIATSTSAASLAGVIASQCMPEKNNWSRIPGLNGPGSRTNGVGITNTQMKMANSTPKP